MQRTATLMGGLAASFATVLLLAGPASASSAAPEPPPAVDTVAVEAQPAPTPPVQSTEAGLQAADRNLSVQGLCNYNGDHPVLRRGATGAAVLHAQCLLKNYHGYGYLAQDGIFGQQTEDAVRDFQRRQGIGVDGVIGSVTWSRLHPY